MLARICSSTGPAHPGCALAERLRQISQTDEERGSGRLRPRSVTHLRLYRQAAIHNKSGANHGANQRFPGIRIFVGKDDDQYAVRAQRSLAAAKDHGHAILKISLTGIMITPEAASVVDQFAIACFVVPLSAKWLGKSGIYFRR
jgi:hypothetical protein